MRAVHQHGKNREHNYEEDIPAQQPPSLDEAWFPRAHAHPFRAMINRRRNKGRKSLSA